MSEALAGTVMQEEGVLLRARVILVYWSFLGRQEI